MKTVGILGYGSFGQFLVRKLEKKLSLLVYDPFQKVPAKCIASLEQIAECDFVVLAIPIDAYEPVLTEIKPMLSPSTVIVDIASVKTTPVGIIEDILPGQSRVVMHPLFGPQSA